MNIRERLQGLLPRKTQPTEFEKQLREQKNSADAVRAIQLRQKTIEEEQRLIRADLLRQREQQRAKDERASLDKLGVQATELFKPKLEVIKKLYLGRKGKIVLNKGDHINIDKYRSILVDYAELMLLWDHQVVHHQEKVSGYDRWGGNSRPDWTDKWDTESYKTVFFRLHNDGTAVFGRRLRNDDHTESYYYKKGSQISEPEYDLITFDTNDKSWENNTMEKINDIVQRTI